MGSPVNPKSMVCPWHVYNPSQIFEGKITHMVNHIGGYVVETKLVLRCSFRCDHIHNCHCNVSGHTL